MTAILIGLGILLLFGTFMILLGTKAQNESSQPGVDFARMLSLSCGELQALLILPDLIEPHAPRGADTQQPENP